MNPQIEHKKMLFFQGEYLPKKRRIAKKWLNASIRFLRQARIPENEKDQYMDFQEWLDGEIRGLELRKKSL